MPTPRSVAPPSIIRPRRADATRGDRDKSKPAKLSVEQRATAKFTPTTTKCESSIGDSTAISRQFAPSSPCSQGSTSSRSGKRPLSAISFQRRSTRQTSRRSSFIVLVCLAGYPRNDRLPEERLNLCKWSRTGAAGCIPAGPEHCRAASQKRLLRARDRKFESISLQRGVIQNPIIPTDLDGQAVGENFQRARARFQTPRHV